MVKGVGAMLIPGVEELDLGLRIRRRNGDNVAFEMVLAGLRQSMESFPGPRLKSHSVRLNPSIAPGGNDVVSSDVTSASFGATPLRSRCAYGAVFFKSLRTVLNVKSARSWR